MNVMIVQAFQMAVTLKIIVALVIVTAPMTVCRIVPEPGVAVQKFQIFIMI